MKPKFLLILVLLIVLPTAAYSQVVIQTSKSKSEPTLVLTGKVKEPVFKTDLLEAMVILFDHDGNPSDTIQTRRKVYRSRDESREESLFFLTLPRRDTVVTFDVAAPGYKTATIAYELKNVGRREEYRRMDPIYLERAPRELKEVTVTASKVKFFHRGDTLVYDADAFQLSEGSMLDALLVQLPGVELRDGGQIYVNGEYVESLLLNGKQFLDGNNQLVLENIAAYTVKNVEVYKGQTREEKWIDDPKAPKHLTMNVKLKKEYMIGWLLNAQGGLGTDSRYTGRWFASWFNPTTTVTFLGNFNNLNDNRKPGKKDSWRPEMLPSGTRRYKMLSIDYNYESADQNKSNNGYFTFEHTSANNRTTTARTNFLPGGDTYDNIFSTESYSNMKLDTRHYMTRSNNRWFTFLMALARYTRNSSRSQSLSGTFSEEQADMTMQALDALYSDGSPERLDAVINRSITRTDGSSHDTELQFFPGLRYKIPGTNDHIYNEFGIKYNNRKEERWRDYNINYGADPTPAVRRRQYFDNTPNHTLTLINNFSYYCRVLGAATLRINYEYRFTDRKRDSYMFALDRLADMGVFGTLPAGYLDTYDPANSYTSHQLENKHSLEPTFYWGVMNEKMTMYIYCAPSLGLQHTHFDYTRAGNNYLVKRSSFVGVAKNGSAAVNFGFTPVKDANGRARMKNNIRYQYMLDTKLPDPTHLIDITDDTDPLNITLGNPDLRNAYTQEHNLSWQWNHQASHPLSNSVALSYSYTDDAIVRGYTYDTATGVRRTRSYNVGGNNTSTASEYISSQFGAKNQFTLTATLTGSLMRYADMIGVNLMEPLKSTADTRNASANMSFTWQIGKQSLQVTGDITRRHTTSTREDFNTINATHCKGGFIGNFTLPAGFGISTDFMLYTRRGYGVKQLDTTDKIWNMRVTYTPRGGHWVIMADAFDLLHQLSNVNYAVNATGRTVSYTNALPRYVMISAQYRLSITPKKRR